MKHFCVRAKTFAFLTKIYLRRTKAAAKQSVTVSRKVKMEYNLLYYNRSILVQHLLLAMAHLLIRLAGRVSSHGHITRIVQSGHLLSIQDAPLSPIILA